MAAQIALRFITENPFATSQELPIKFLVLINSAVPPCIMPLEGQEVTDIPIEEAPTFQMLFDIFKADPSDWKDKARPAKLANGRKVRMRCSWRPSVPKIDSILNSCSDSQACRSWPTTRIT